MKMMCFALAGFLASSANAIAADTGVGYLLESSWQGYNDDSIINVARNLIPQPTSSRTQIVELNYNPSILATTTAARAIQYSGKPGQQELRVKEFVLASNLGEWEWSVGRRISSFGLGYAFRPLDLIQQQDLLTHEQESLTGVNQLSLETYRDLDSFGLYLVNPGQYNSDKPSKRSALLGRYAASRELIDWQTILRYSEDNRLQAGVGGIRIINNALSLHGSLLWSSRYQRWLNQLATEDASLLAETDPWFQQTYNNGVNGMLGANWTWSDKQNLIVEYWHNDFALSGQQWREHLSLMQAQKRLLSLDNPSAVPAEVIEGNIAWSARVFANFSRMQNNLMTRWSYSGDKVQPRLTLLYSPDDAGLMTEASFTVDDYALKFLAGIRYFSGPDDSAYSQLIEQGKLYLSVYGNF